MKKVTGIVSFIFCLLMLAGCSSAIPEMSESDTALVTSYAAELLLKYDTNYDSKLLNDSEKEEALQNQIEKKQKEEQLAAIKAEEEALKEKEKAESEKLSEDQRESEELAIPERTYYPIADLLSLKNISIQYTGFELLDRYPEGNADSMLFQMKASEGKKLLVLHFDIANETSSDIRVDILSLNVRFGIKINEQKEKNSLTTLLMDDLATYQGTLAVEQVVPTVLIIEVDPTDEESVNSIDMNVKCNGNKVITSIY